MLEVWTTLGFDRMSCGRAAAGDARASARSTAVYVRARAVLSRINPPSKTVSESEQVVRVSALRSDRGVILSEASRVPTILKAMTIGTYERTVVIVRIEGRAE